MTETRRHSSRRTTFFDQTPTAEELAAGRDFLKYLRREVVRKSSHEIPSVQRSAEADEDGDLGHVQARVLVDAGDMHMTEMTMAPGTMISHHRHGLDQIVLVVSGSLWQGNRQIKAGGGFFTPAGTPYAFRVGETGATFHEFFYGRVEDWSPEVLAE
jgi:quercetin dioxygenase-like cupin family protein